jgi:ABC-2 type transport system ATP-binding protein
LEVAHVEDGLAVRGPQAHVDALVADIVRSGVAIRGLRLDEAPLEALFFMLTESSPDAPTSDLNRTAGARE